MNEKELSALREKLIDQAIINKPKEDIFVYLYNTELASNLDDEERKNIIFNALLKPQQRTDVAVKKESNSPFVKQSFNEHKIAICYFK